MGVGVARSLGRTWPLKGRRLTEVGVSFSHFGREAAFGGPAPVCPVFACLVPSQNDVGINHLAHAC